MNRLKLFGIPIQLHWSVWILVAFILFPFSSYEQFTYQAYLAFMIPAVVLAHELGHALVAIRYGFSVQKIMLIALGGQALISMKKPFTPKEELAITFAGPAVNLVLGVAGIIAHKILLDLGYVSFDTVASKYIISFWLINFMMGIFNLVPAYPMDGGRLLRAGLSMFYGSVKATKMATSLSMTISGVMGILAIAIFNPILFLISGYVMFISYSEYKEAAGIL